MSFKRILFSIIIIHIFSFVDPSVATENKKPMKDTIKDQAQTAINNLSPQNSFAYYDLQLSDQEIKILKSLKINTTDEYNNYGNLNALEPEVRKFIQSLSPKNKTTAEAASQIIVQIVNDIVQASGQETAWIAVRSFTSTSEYDVPRWHTDGYYYEPRRGNPYKFALTLKGESTLFYRLPATERDAFSALQRKGTEQNQYNRHALADLLGRSPEALSITKPNQGAVFIVGSDIAAVHSEPPIHEERLFLSVLPGSREQIKEWEKQ